MSFVTLFEDHLKRTVTARLTEVSVYYPKRICCDLDVIAFLMPISPVNPALPSLVPDLVLEIDICL